MHPTLLTGKWGVNPFYNFGGNSIGVFLTYQVTPDFGGYLVWDQSLTSDFGLYGFGLTSPLFENYVVGFAEIGSNYGEPAELTFIMGMYFIFGKGVKRW